MAQLSIRMDDALKRQAEELFKALGMNLSTAINVFVQQSVREKRIPFVLSAAGDPFFDERNIQYLTNIKNDPDRQSRMSVHELIDDTDD
jgi:DNA-damage-inducible protein J